jgi:hypothetical protein
MKELLNTDSLDLRLPDIPEEEQKQMIGGATLPTCYISVSYPDYDDFYNDMGDTFGGTGYPTDEYYYGGGGGPASGDGDDSPDETPDETPDEPQDCTCVSEMTSDMMDGLLGSNTAQNIESAAEAAGLWSTFSGISWETLDTFADSLGITGSSADIIKGMSKGFGIVGAVTDTTSLVFALSDGSVDLEDWDEVAGAALTAVGIVGTALSAPVWITYGAAGAGVVVTILAVKGVGQGDGSAVSQPAASVTADSDPCPVHG